ncbi:MAG TPA: hypothetical protein VEW03_08555, partial [Longimicrobiaceae bacterium]|nr:hypothetical protein [Longimicrobiaceae bacterium]
MTYQFPHEIAYLPRTKLAYVNLPGILSDGKRERAARVPGFVCIQLGERGYLVFLRGGEPFNAARLQPDSRGSIALSEVLRLVSTESERGESGQIGYFGAPEAQLQAMLATLLHPPAVWDDPIDTARPDRLFPQLRERRFSGVLELHDGVSFHYVRFEDGAYREGWFTDRAPATPVGDFVRAVFDAAGARLRATPFPGCEELPVQAGPGFVDLYRRLVGGVLREVVQAAGRETALALLRRGQALAALDHPAVAAFQVTEEGRVSGDPVATPAQLTEGVAAWLTEVLIGASEHHGVDPAAVIEKTARDSRFVLSEHGFFQRLPWA